MSDQALGTRKWVGQALPRFEDQTLLRGRGRYIDDIHPVPGAQHAAILRFPHAHARIRRVDVSGAEAIEVVCGVLTGTDVRSMSKPFAAACDSPVPYYAAAAEVVRYVGESVAVVVASDRYCAEDALERIEVEYEPRPPVLDPVRLRRPDGLASRKLGVPVRWTEDRLEHLASSQTSTGRPPTIEGAFAADGELLGMRIDAIDDVGAYVRAPEPASMYRMHGALRAYRVRNVALRARVVLTNRARRRSTGASAGPSITYQSRG